MKKIKIFSALLLCFCFFQTQAQVIVDGVNINEEEDVKVVQLVAFGNLFSKKVTITVDYGQFIKLGSTKGSIVTDRNGDLRKFNSNMDAVNYMENNGWELVEVNSVPNPNSTGITSYFFKRQKQE